MRSWYISKESTTYQSNKSKVEEAMMNLVSPVDELGTEDLGGEAMTLSTS